MTPRWRSFLPALTCALLAPLALATAPSPTAPAQVGATAPIATAGATDSNHSLEGDTTSRRGSGGIRKWHTRRLTYYEATPAMWHWSLQTAIDQWNSSGARFTFVRAASRSKAKLVISYGNTHGFAGYASIGPASHPYVHLDPGFASADAGAAGNRIFAAALFAHELGHVVGFNHASAHCSLMHATIDILGCGMLLRDQPGYYRCQIIDQATVARFVRAYRGRAHLVPGSCLIDTLPPDITGASFTGGAALGLPVTLHWIPPVAPPGSTMQIWVWPTAACGSGQAPDLEVSPADGQWTDTDAYDSGPHCYAMRLVNRYGAGLGVVQQVMDRWVTPAPAPFIGPTLGTVATASSRFQSPEGRTPLPRCRSTTWIHLRASRATTLPRRRTCLFTAGRRS